MGRKHLIGMGTFVIVTLGWALLYHPRPHPSDMTLMEYFKDHQSDFDVLVEMFKADVGVRTLYSGQVMLNSYEIWPTNTKEGFSHERWNHYLRVFARLHEFQIDIISRDGDTIHIPASVAVSELDDSEPIVLVKGYAYSLEELNPQVESLDQTGFDNGGIHYRKINDHWYLYHEWRISRSC